ncbi:MAG: dihydroorotase, partial [Candidatus Latescibacterota bacterium]
MYDLIIKNGTLIDPAQNIHAIKDVAFSDGVVAAIGDQLTDAHEVIDAS